ncbi:MAG: hypothetical protein ABI333_13195 [bacterium]
MHRGTCSAVGIGLGIGLLAIAFPQVALPRPAKAGLRDVPDLRRKLKSPDIGVRTKAVTTLQSSIRSEASVVKTLAPELRRMAVQDPVCRVRVAALRALVWRRAQVGGTPVQAILRAMVDTCPLVNSRGADWVEYLTKAHQRSIVPRLLALAEKSR